MKIILSGKTLKPPTKKELASWIIANKAWGGEKSINSLCNRYKKSELKDILHTMRYM